MITALNISNRFVLKMVEAWSSECWHSATSLRGVATQKTAT